MSKRTLVVCVLLAVSLGLFAADTGGTPLPAPLANALKKSGFQVPTKAMPFEDFTLTALDGSRVSLGSFKGKVVVLSFWATWCGPCKQELPSMQALYTKMKPRGLEIVAVDLGEEKNAVSRFVKENGLSFPVLLDSNFTVGSAYGANSIPTNYIIDKNGRIIARVIGFDGKEWTSADRVSLFEKLLAL